MKIPLTKKELAVSICLCVLFIALGVTVILLGSLYGENSETLSTLNMLLGVVLLMNVITVFVVRYGQTILRRKYPPKNVKSVILIALIVPCATFAIACASFGIHYASSTAAVYVSLVAVGVQVILSSLCVYALSNAAVKAKMAEDREVTEKELTELIERRRAEAEAQKQRSREINAENNPNKKKNK